MNFAFIGTVTSLPLVVENGDLVYLDQGSNSGYYMYVNNSWIRFADLNLTNVRQLAIQNNLTESDLIAAINLYLESR